MDERIKQLIAGHEEFQRLEKEFSLDFVVDNFTKSINPEVRLLGEFLEDNPIDLSLFLSGLVFYWRSVFEQYKKREFTDKDIIEAFAPPLRQIVHPKAIFKDLKFYQHILKEYEKFYQHIADDYRKRDTNGIIEEAVACNPLRQIVHPKAKQQELEFYQYIARDLTGEEYPLISWTVARVAPLKDCEALVSLCQKYRHLYPYLRDSASIHRNYLHLYRDLREMRDVYTTPLTVKDVREAIEIFRLGGNDCSGAKKATAYAYMFTIGRFLAPATKMWDKMDFPEIVANQNPFSIFRNTYEMSKEMLRPNRLISQ